MFDRSVQFPMRYQLQKVAGTDDIYDLIPAPGEIQNEGTLINKSTLLTDAVASMFGFGASAVPNDVLSVLSNAALYKTAPQIAQLNTLEAGDVIYLNESGTPAPYIVVNQGIPQNSTLYDSSCNGTWVLRKDVYSNLVWDSANSNVLPGADIFNTLSGLLSLYDSDVQSAIKTVKVPYCIGGSSSTIMSGANGLSCKIFPLSSYECGITTSQGSYPIDGALLDYFSLGVDSAANTKRISYFNGSPAQWWTRSPITNSSNFAAYFDTSGRNGAGSSNGSKGLRPAFILDPTLVVVTKLPTTGLFDVNNNLIQQLPAAQIETGSYVGTGTYGASNPNTLTFSFSPKLVFISADNASFGYGMVYAIVMLVNGRTSFRIMYNGTQYGTNALTWGKTISWYCTQVSEVAYGPRSQLNESGTTYRFVAFG